MLKSRAVKELSVEFRVTSEVQPPTNKEVRTLEWQSKVTRLAQLVASHVDNDPIPVDASNAAIIVPDTSRDVMDGLFMRFKVAKDGLLLTSNNVREVE